MSADSLYLFLYLHRGRLSIDLRTKLPPLESE
jgi:hypothetical protein